MRGYTTQDEEDVSLGSIHLLAENLRDKSIERYEDFWSVLKCRIDRNDVDANVIDDVLINDIVPVTPDTLGSTRLFKEKMPNGQYCRPIRFTGKAMDGIDHLRRLQREIYEVRTGKREYIYGKDYRNKYPIRLTSWLNAKPAHFSLVTGISLDELGESGGYYISGIDVASLLLDSENTTVAPYVAPSEMLRISALNMMLNVSFMEKFLARGEFPKLGLALIPGELFFQY